MPLHAKAKRTMQVAAIAFAEMHDCEVIADAHVTRITTDGFGAANGVEYKIKGDPTTYTENAHVVFLGGGAIESVRLYLNSGLPEPNPGTPQVGYWLTDHQQSEVAFYINDVETLPHTGNVVGGYITNATLTDQRDGIIESIGGLFPMVGVNLILSVPQKDPDNLSQPHPTRQVIWGQGFKELMGRFKHATGMGTQTNDEMVYDNHITVSDSVADEYGPVAEIHYEPTALTMERHERQTARKVDFARQAGGSNAEIVMNYPGGTGNHPLGTLRMGDSQASSVCDLHQECWTVPGLYICDASVLPNGLGGANPARTINAFASRAAYYAMQKYFPGRWVSRTWPW
jgi:choline dehydrogenase-like flavoprotein